MTIASMITLALSFVCALAASWGLLMPFFREEEETGRRGADLKRRELLIRKERLLLAIEDLEQEQRMGKVSDQDYQRTRVELRREAGECVAALEALAAEPERRKKK